jgi:hypothetical protein
MGSAAAGSPVPAVEAEGSDAGGVEVPFCGVAADEPHGAVGVVAGLSLKTIYRGVFAEQSIFYDYGGDADAV